MNIQNLLSHSLGSETLLTMLVSMLPVVELRGGIPFGVNAGLPISLAAIASIIGNMLPIPILILFTRRVLTWLRHHLPVLERWIVRLERKADSKKELILKYKFWGLLILVAIPLPGTGAWTGALIAALMDLRLKSALLAIFTGVLVAAAIVSCITVGLFSL